MDGGMFVFVDSDVGEEELKAFTKKIKRIHRKKELKRNGKRNKNSSATSSLTPSVGSHRDCDAASVSSATSSVENQAESLSKTKKRKRKTKDRTCDSPPAKKLNKTEKKKEISCNNCDSPPAKKSIKTEKEKEISCNNCSESNSNTGDKEIQTAQIQTNDSKVRNTFTSTSCDKNTNGNPSNIPDITKSNGKDKSFKLKVSKGSSLWGTEGRDDDDEYASENSLHGAFLDLSHKIDAVEKPKYMSCLTRCRSCMAYILPEISKDEHENMTEFVALDCEFVGVGPNNSSALGRCSIVDYRGHLLYDRFVKPAEPVTDYRTRWSGLRSSNIRLGIPVEVARQQIANIIKDKIVVGHAVHNDFRVLCIPHPLHQLRDTASCKLLMEKAGLPNNASALRKLTFALLGRTIQHKEHCSVTDARASMDLFRLVRPEWEPILRAKLQRRQARAASGSVLKVKVEGEVEDSEDVSLYLGDEYWPANTFRESIDNC